MATRKLGQAPKKSSVSHKPAATTGAKAPAAPATSPSEEKPEAPKVLGAVGRFSFALETVPEVPEPTLSRGPSARDLPFKSWFGEMGHNAHVFLPHEFWTASADEGGRGVDPKKATVGYVRAKIRDAFNTWVSKDEEARSDRRLILVPRKKGDDNGRFTEDGTSVFMQIVPKE